MMCMRIFLVILLIICIVCIISWIVDTHRFVVRHYEFSSPKIKKDFRFVLLTDLHNKDYGEDNAKLLQAIDECKPDAVIIAGDLCNGLKDNDYSVAVKLAQALKEKYPLYYGMGNHEFRLKIYPDIYGTMWDEYSSLLEDSEIHIMDNEHVLLPEVGVDIASVTIGREFYKRFNITNLTAEDMRGYLGEASTDAYQLLIAHNPEYFEGYSDWGADLTVSGHVHGGIMRLPIIGGFVSPRLVRFPKYSDGEYTLNNKHMVVSCGLGTHTIHVRVFNPGELSVIDLKPER